MHLLAYTLLAATATASAAADTHTKPLLKIPAIWQSPLFKSSNPSVASHSSPASAKSTLQETFQIHEPAPILTNTPQICSVTLVSRSFANSYGSPSYLSYDPASFGGTPCSNPDEWTGLTLDIHGETRGRQFDRLGTVWVGNNRTGQGVEVMRLDNPEPTRTGVFWDIKKDVGKYWSLFSEKADVVFDLPNIVDDTYTGALNVTLKLSASVDGVMQSRGGKHRRRPVAQTALSLKNRSADVVIPLSKRLRTNNSIFLVGGTAGNGTTSITLPQNAARAIVEIYASGTATEEFWYTGIPDRFYNQIPDASEDGYYGHGTYREVQLYIDGTFAGFVTPYPIIYTGGINPLLWRPSANYGTFDQPTYNVDVTPWLGGLTDGKEHVFELAVVSSERDGEINDASWFVSGNVQVYLDASEERTTGKMLKVESGGEDVDGYAEGKLVGDPLTNGSLTYTVGLKRGRSFGVAGSIKTGSGVEYVAGWYQSAEYSNHGFVNATAQTNDQKSYGWTRSIVLGAGKVDTVMDAGISLDELQTLADTQGVGAVQLDYNYPLYAASYLSNTDFDVQVNQQFDRTVRRASHNSQHNDLIQLVGDETTFVHAEPVAALPHATLSSRKGTADSVLVNGAIANGTGTSDQTFMYRDVAGGTIDRHTRTNTTSVLQDTLAGSASGRAQPAQLAVV